MDEIRHLRCKGCGAMWIDDGGPRAIYDCSCTCEPDDPLYGVWEDRFDILRFWGHSNYPEWWEEHGYPDITNQMCRWLANQFHRSVTWTTDLESLDFFFGHPELWGILGYPGNPDQPPKNRLRRR